VPPAVRVEPGHRRGGRRGELGHGRLDLGLLLAVEAVSGRAHLLGHDRQADPPRPALLQRRGGQLLEQDPLADVGRRKLIGPLLDLALGRLLVGQDQVLGESIGLGRRSGAGPHGTHGVKEGVSVIRVWTHRHRQTSEASVATHQNRMHVGGLRCADPPYNYNSGRKAGRAVKSGGSIAKTGSPPSGGPRPHSRYNRQSRWFDCQNGLAAFWRPPAAQPAQP
jgi:hypothetical protein